MTNEAKLPLEHPRFGALTALAQIVIAVSNHQTPEMYQAWLETEIEIDPTIIKPTSRLGKLAQQQKIKSAVRDYRDLYHDWWKDANPTTKDILLKTARLISAIFPLVENQPLNDNHFENIFWLLHQPKLALIQ